MTTRHRLLPPGLFLGIAFASACGSGLRARELGEPCDVDTPCGSAYACSYGYCRTGCDSEIDCSGRACLKASATTGVCALPPENEGCQQQGCPSGLSCSMSGACLTPCKGGCLPTQACVENLCVGAPGGGGGAAGTGGTAGSGTAGNGGIGTGQAGASGAAGYAGAATGGGGGSSGAGMAGSAAASGTAGSAGGAGAPCTPNAAIKCAPDGNVYNYDSCGAQGAKKATCTASGCSAGACRCGNGIIDINEECDGANTGPKTCIDYGYNAGSLSCSLCSIVVSGCSCSPNVCQSAGKSSGTLCAGNVYTTCGPSTANCSVVKNSADCGAAKTCGPQGCAQKYCRVYVDNTYGGASQTINAVASLPDLGTIGMHDKISSARCFNGAKLTLWVDKDFAGTCFKSPAPCKLTITGDVPDFKAFGGDADDNASSATVE